MKILLLSPNFFPLIGGVETMAAELGRLLMEAGHEVIVVCHQPPSTKPGEADRELFPFEVVRRPSRTRYFALVRWCDVLFMCGGLTLWGAWPWLFLRPKLMIRHGTWVQMPGEAPTLVTRLKAKVASLADLNIAVSEAIREPLGPRAVVINNFYRDDLFRPLPDARRSRDVVFVGRLVSDKGVDLALHSLAILAREGLRSTLTIIGIGPEMDNLKRLAAELNLANQVRFAGALSGQALVDEINDHRIGIVPSRWPEPFGIVALELQACGCTVVAARTAGLVEAGGPGALYHEPDDAAGLATALRRLLQEPALVEECREKASPHLEAHRRAPTMARYLEAMKQLA